jgi:hypothetical protein
VENSCVGLQVYRNRISPDPIFLAVGSESTGGFYAINRCAQGCTLVGGCSCLLLGVDVHHHRVITRQ